MNVNMSKAGENFLDQSDDYYEESLPAADELPLPPDFLWALLYARALPDPPADSDCYIRTKAQEERGMAEVFVDLQGSGSIQVYLRLNFLAGNPFIRTIITTHDTMPLVAEELASTWPIVHAFTFGTYFFQQAGLSDSFKIKVITASIQIGTVLVLVTIIDRLGRRYLACGGTTISWAACLAIGIIGVVPKGNPSTYVFVFLPTFRMLAWPQTVQRGGGILGRSHPSACDHIPLALVLL
ncbi:hypothetical protein ETB97_003543 [Aspergillus alliaceus]|uniref:Major facilitator superfamily (MFS) profile domain-containing protein n=1 Tax=Petromyces alliaceus TaxID=209559 RepID=A0A8H6A1K6_PETAA|nr:hypothetical protein ETB97_003543 [Aspergillus burnettii]